MRELYLVSPPCRYTRLSRALEICKRFYMLILHLVLIVSFGSTDWGAGVPNPYNGIINGLGATTNLHVWYRWPYTPAGVAAMVAFHGNPLPAQVGIIAGW